MRIASRSLILLVAVLLIGAGAPLAQAQSRLAPGTVDGVVTDSNLVSLADATASILGSSIQVVTGANGRFRILQLPAGRYVIVVRHPGYVPVSTALQVAAGDTLRLSFALERIASSLDTVRIRGDRRVSARLDDFERRLARGEATVSITKEEIDKRNPFLISQLLQNVPSVRISENLTGKTLPISNRGMKMALVPLPGGKAENRMVPCLMAVMVDGLLMPDSTSVDLMPPRMVHGIEVFAGAASIPVKLGSLLNGQWCGLIAIWTRDR